MVRLCCACRISNAQSWVQRPVPDGCVLRNDCPAPCLQSRAAFCAGSVDCARGFLSRTWYNALMCHCLQIHWQLDGHDAVPQPDKSDPGACNKFLAGSTAAADRFASASGSEHSSDEVQPQLCLSLSSCDARLTDACC